MIHDALMRCILRERHVRWPICDYFKNASKTLPACRCAAILMLGFMAIVHCATARARCGAGVLAGRVDGNAAVGVSER